MTRWSAPTPRAPTLLWECFSTTSSTSRTASRCPLPWVIQRVRAMLVLWSSLQLTGDVCAKSCCGAARFRTASASGCPLGSLRVTAGLGEELVLEGLACLQGSGGTVFGVRPGGVCGESAAELSFLRCERHSVLLKYQGGDSCRNRLECRRPGWARTRPQFVTAGDRPARG